MTRKPHAGGGQALAELAVCLPVLILLLFATCQLALIGQAACFAKLASMRAARAYVVYCQQGPGYALAMAGQAAALAVERCRPRPQVTVELEEDEGEREGGGGASGGGQARTRSVLAFATGMSGLKDSKQDEKVPLVTLKAEVVYPLLFPAVRGVFGGRPCVSLVSRSILTREDTLDFFKAHPEIHNNG